MQAGKMASIYSNALFTIATSTSHNPSQGLFVNRWTTSVAFQSEATTPNVQSGLPESKRLHYASGSVQMIKGPYTYRLGSTDLISHRVMASTGLILGREEAPLFTRAWAFQERVLSTRIVYFLPSELVWECNSGISCDCGNMNVPERFAWSHDRFFGGPRKGPLSPLQGSKLRRANRCNEWQKLVAQYTSLNLSFESDRIAAFSGIAASFAESSTGQYIAGMWTDMLPVALCWSPAQKEVGASTTEKRCTTVAPSWSWASLQLSQGDSIHYRHAIGLPEMACPNFKIIRTENVLSGKNPYGGVQHSTLTVQALCFDCAPGSDDKYHNRLCVSRTDTDAEPVWSRHVQDFIIDHDTWFRGKAGIVVMYLGWERGLVLVEAKHEITGATVYRRLGIALLYPCMCGKLQRYADLRQITWSRRTRIYLMGSDARLPSMRGVSPL
jgi:hypothetical protein